MGTDESLKTVQRTVTRTKATDTYDILSHRPQLAPWDDTLPHTRPKDPPSLHHIVMYTAITWNSHKPACGTWTKSAKAKVPEEALLSTSTWKYLQTTLYLNFPINLRRTEIGSKQLH